MSKITNVDEACERIHEAHPDWKLNSVVEYNEYFVFDAVPKDHDLEKDGPCLLGFTCVRKNDGKVFGFNPLYNNPRVFFREWENNGLLIKEV